MGTSITGEEGRQGGGWCPLKEGRGCLSSHRQAAAELGLKAAGLAPRGSCSCRCTGLGVPRGAEATLPPSPAQERGCQAAGRLCLDPHVGGHHWAAGQDTGQSGVCTKTTILQTPGLAEEG